MRRTGRRPVRRPQRCWAACVHRSFSCSLSLSPWILYLWPMRAPTRQHCRWSRRLSTLRGMIHKSLCPSARLHHCRSTSTMLWSRRPAGETGAGAPRWISMDRPSMARCLVSPKPEGGSPSVWSTTGLAEDCVITRRAPPSPPSHRRRRRIGGCQATHYGKSVKGGVPFLILWGSWGEHGKASGDSEGLFGQESY